MRKRGEMKSATWKRVKKLKCRSESEEKAEGGGIWHGQEVDVKLREENERMRHRLYGLERKMEGEEREKRKRNVVITVMDVESVLGKKEAEKLGRGHFCRGPTTTHNII